MKRRFVVARKQETATGARYLPCGTLVERAGGKMLLYLNMFPQKLYVFAVEERDENERCAPADNCEP